MTLELAVRVLLVLATVGSWLAAAWLLRRHETLKSHSISSHGGMDDLAYLVFGLTLTIGALSVLLFGFYWIIPQFEPPPLFTLVLVAGVILQLLTAWIRERYSNPLLHRLHWIVSFSMAGTWPVMLLILLRTTHLPPLAAAFSVVSLILMTIFWVAFLWVPPSRGYFLWFQGAYILSFQLAFAAIAISG